LEEPIEGWLYDGITARRHIVSVRSENDRLLIEGHETVAVADLVRRGDRSRSVFGRSGNAGWRLGFDRPLPDDWQNLLPAEPRYGRLIDRFGLTRAVLAALAVSAALLFMLYQLPNCVAPLVPQKWEQAFGDALVGDLGGRACHSAEADAVLDALGQRLSAGGRPMRVRVVDLPIPNAVALPGGQIALFNGIIQQAKSPDEIAGVLGHEIGHVEHRHVMAGLIRQFGLGLVLGGSGKSVQYAQALVDARYGRAAESDADAYAIAALTRNHISTKPTADFFQRMSRMEKSGSSTVDTAFSWLSNHPVSAARRDMFLEADTHIAYPRPAMSAAQWSLVKQMCATRKGN
jgi:Zn-dependent protease with chaperone function